MNFSEEPVIKPGNLFYYNFSPGLGSHYILIQAVGRTPEGVPYVIYLLSSGEISYRFDHDIHEIRHWLNNLMWTGVFE